VDDLVERLRQAVVRWSAGVTLENPELLVAAADEIERLRGLVGAVSAGPSFRQIVDGAKPLPDREKWANDMRDAM
jgi:hypothetical protein